MLERMLQVCVCGGGGAWHGEADDKDCSEIGLREWVERVG